MPPTENPFALARRERKLAALVLAIDARALKAGLDPHRDAAEIARLLGTMGAVGWSQLAKLARCNAPSATTVGLVVAHYRARAAVLTEFEVASLGWLITDARVHAL